MYQKNYISGQDAVLSPCPVLSSHNQAFLGAPHSFLKLSFLALRKNRQVFDLQNKDCTKYKQ